MHGVCVTFLNLQQIKAFAPESLQTPRVWDWSFCWWSACAPDQGSEPPKSWGFWSIFVAWSRSTLGMQSPTTWGLHEVLLGQDKAHLVQDVFLTRLSNIIKHWQTSCLCASTLGMQKTQVTCRIKHFIHVYIAPSWIMQGSSELKEIRILHAKSKSASARHPIEHPGRLLPALHGTKRLHLAVT